MIPSAVGDIHCPVCNAVNGPTLEFCHACGERIRIQSRAAGRARRIASARRESSECVRCGEPLPASADRCPVCKFPLDPEQERAWRLYQAWGNTQARLQRIVYYIPGAVIILMSAGLGVTCVLEFIANYRRLNLGPLLFYLAGAACGFAAAAAASWLIYRDVQGYQEFCRNREDGAYDGFECNDGGNFVDESAEE